MNSAANAAASPNSANAMDIARAGSIPSAVNAAKRSSRWDRNSSSIDSRSVALSRNKRLSKPR
ncbi:MAG: hypothetical protein ABSG67_03375 [Thermoguttaceae bacterium]